MMTRVFTETATETISQISAFFFQEQPFKSSFFLNEQIFSRKKTFLIIKYRCYFPGNLVCLSNTCRFLGSLTSLLNTYEFPGASIFLSNRYQSFPKSPIWLSNTYDFPRNPCHRTNRHFPERYLPMKSDVPGWWNN